MDSLINRQVAIDAIGRASDELYENIKKGATFPQRQWFDGMAQAQSILEDLPSTQPETCEDAVRREDVQSITEKSDWFESSDSFNDFLWALYALPSVTPKRKTGKWKKIGHWGRCYRCDQCGNVLDFDGVNAGRGDANFCPNCGAEMEG